MDDELTDPQDDAALRAFRQMQEEARERHAELMARLAEAPDYASSLAVIQKTLDWMVERYANTVTIDDMLKRVADTAAEMDQPHQQALESARADMGESRRAMEESRKAYERSLQRARTVSDQAGQNRRWLISGLAGGALAMMILPGMLARAAPSPWLLPERLAARILRLSMTDAGTHLLVAANPQAASEIMEGAQLMFDNRAAIAKCRHGHGKAQGAVVCKVKLAM